MKKKLKRDIVIPAGTVFDTAPSTVLRYGDDHISAIFGLTNDTSGDITYCLDGDKELDEWFEDLE